MSNMRSSGADEAIKLVPPIEITIERGLEIMLVDEYLGSDPTLGASPQTTLDRNGSDQSWSQEVVNVEVKRNPEPRPGVLVWEWFSYKETDLSKEGEGNHRKESEEESHRCLFTFASDFGGVGTSGATAPSQASPFLLLPYMCMFVFGLSLGRLC